MLARLGQDLAEAVLASQRHGLRQVLGEPIVRGGALAERQPEEQIGPQAGVRVARDLERGERALQQARGVGVGADVGGRQRRPPRVLDGLRGRRRAGAAESR